MKRFLVFSGLLLGTTLFLTPEAARADDKRKIKVIRYYDRDARDYHSWDDREDRAYRAYLKEQRREYIHFQKAKRNHRKEYYRWRHSHPDSVLRLEIR